MMEQYRYDFSVVMAVYNVERFLREAVDSLIHQTLGFSRIQLILVDDGSPDGSGAICDEYQKQYPDNVVVIHKENGRQASARNAGLKHVRGKYVNFMDSDDIMEKTAFKKVFDFMEAHEGETDVCCVPMYFFEDAGGPHVLNDKFEKGTRVIDLTVRENADCILLSASTTFFTRSGIRDLTFDTELFHAEDAKFVLQTLMRKPKLGVVADTRYLYRKFGGSTIDKSRLVPLSYAPYLTHFSNWILDEAFGKFGEVPGFIQFAVMYDLQWKIKQRDIPSGVLSDEEAEKYKQLLIQTASRIDDDIILRQKQLEATYKAYILSRKCGKAPTLDTTDSDVVLRFEGGAAVGLSEMPTGWDFMTIDARSKTCTLEGYHFCAFVDTAAVKPCLLIDGRELSCEITDRSRMVRVSLGETVAFAQGFRATFPLPERALEVRAALRVNGALVERNVLAFRDFFPISEVYKNAYAWLNGYMVTMSGKSFRIARGVSWAGRLLRECRLLKEIWREDLTGGRKAVGGRIYYHFVKPFKRRQLWIVSDRVNKADDNGEALFRYIQDHKPQNTRVVFAVRKDSEDYARMSKLGECIGGMTFRHKLMYLLSDVNISAQAEGASMFGGYSDALRDLLQHQHFVFLQHGITKDDVSDWLNRFNKNLSGLVTAARPEWESFARGDYGYTENEIWLTGFPRFDRLYRNEAKVVTVMPTWRRYLMDSLDVKTGEWRLGGGFTEQEYYRFYDALLNSERLLSALESRGYRLRFFPHPNIQGYIPAFHHDPRVEFLPLKTSYRDVYAESNLVVTDYSSAVFDFAYLRKPVLYCQFDSIEFFEGSHVYTKGYFDYERDGFGEVTYDLDSTIDKIIEYVENDCQLKDVYRERIDRFFAFNDQNNCQRVLEKILALPPKG